METLTLHAYAKINLTLDVTGRRDDGYHFIESILQSVSLADTVTLCRTDSSGITVVCRDPNVPDDQTNTAYRAAAVFLQETGLPGGIRIQIEKVIPSQAGLAGGSADAAAVLWGMDRLWDTGLAAERLAKLGLQVGADVPFCLQGGTGLAEGIGEILTPLPALPDCWIVLCKPACGVSTKEAYRTIDSIPILRRPDTSAMLRAIRQGDWACIPSQTGNLFQTALRIPEVEEIVASMRRYGAENACMSGSGPTVFGLFSQPELAYACRDALALQYPAAYVCQPVPYGVHPIEK